MTYQSACQFVGAQIPLAIFLAGGLTPNRDEAADLAQEALTRALKNWRRLDPKREQAPWLRTVMRNALIDGRKKGDASRCISIDAPNQEGGVFGDLLAGRDLSPENELIQREDVMNVRRVLARLHPDLRKVLSLVDMDGQQYDDAAKTLGIPTGTVRSRLSRARVMFRRQWALAGGENHV